MLHSHKMFTLAKLSYMACNEKEKFHYNSLQTPRIGVKSCCIDILSYIKVKTNCNMSDNVDSINSCGNYKNNKHVL